MGVLNEPRLVNPFATSAEAFQPSPRPQMYPMFCPILASEIPMWMWVKMEDLGDHRC